MKKYKDSKKLLEDLKSNKIKEGESIILDEGGIEPRDQFDISGGNLQTLKAIPDMMIDQQYRTKLRRLTLEFLFCRGNRNRCYW